RVYSRRFSYRRTENPSIDWSNAVSNRPTGPAPRTCTRLQEGSVSALVDADCGGIRLLARADYAAGRTYPAVPGRCSEFLAPGVAGRRMERPAPGDSFAPILRGLTAHRDPLSISLTVTPRRRRRTRARR